MVSLPNIPHDTDAEQMILGNCLLSGSVAPLADLSEAHFYSENNRKIYTAIRSVDGEGKPINHVELLRWFQEHGNSFSPSLVAAVSDGVPELTLKTLEHYIDRLRGSLEQRIAQREATQLAESAMAGATVEEIRETAQRIADKAAPKPAAKNEKRLYPDAPAEAWRSYACLYREAVGASTEASDNFHLFSFLAGIGALLGRSVYTQMGRRIYPNLFLVLVGEAGRARKGTALEYMLQFVEDVDPDVYMTYTVASAPGFIQDLADAQTAQRDQKKLFNELRCILSIDEFRSLIEKSLQKATGDITPTLCKAYDCPSKLDHPTRQNAKNVEQPTLIIMAGTSPSYLQNLSLADIEGGLGSRLTFVPGDPKPRKADPPDPDSMILNTIKPKIRDVIDYYRSRGVTRIGLAKEAHERWVKFYEQEYNPPGNDPLVMVLSERDHMTCRKLALIYAALDKSEVIELFHLEAAIRAVEFLYEARFPVFSGHGLSRSARAQQKIIELVNQRGRLSLAKLQTLLWRHCDGIWLGRHLKALTYPGGPLRVTVVGKKTWIDRGEGVSG